MLVLGEVPGRRVLRDHGLVVGPGEARWRAVARAHVVLVNGAHGVARRRRSEQRRVVLGQHRRVRVGRRGGGRGAVVGRIAEGGRVRRVARAEEVEVGRQVVGGRVGPGVGGRGSRRRRGEWVQ